MSEEAEYTKDPRPVCKYAPKCYQKNTEHAKKFKHPKKQRSPVKDDCPPKKIIKLDAVRTPNSPTKVVDDISDRRSKSPEVDVGRLARTKIPSPIPPSVVPPSKKPSLDHKANVSSSKHGEEEVSGTHDIPEDVSEFIQEKFLVEMPDDFHSFWEFCSSLATKGGVKNVFKAVNLLMVGPFDVLLGNLPIRKNDSHYLLHWRYFYDPPEFQTILTSVGSNGFHMGYFRDSPSESPCFVASNEADKGCKIIPVAENIFGAVLAYLETTKKKSPFMSIACQKLITPLKEWANKNNFTLEPNTPLMKKRMNSVVAKTFHGAGILVPYNRETMLGYRRPIEPDDKLKEMISDVVNAINDSEKTVAFAILQHVITCANIATDECDFGTGLELGMDFFCTGERVLHTSAEQLLSVAYDMLNRNEYAQIVKVHLKNRRKGTDLSCANLN